MRNYYNFRIPTIEEEFETILSSIRWADFFRKNGYSVIWPTTEIFQPLIKNPKALVDIDLQDLKEIFRKEEYTQKTDFYESAVNLLKESWSIESEYIQVGKKLSKNWGFKLYDNYTVIPTAYGPGGGYNTSKRIITILALPNLKFIKQPKVTIAHETIHIGVQDLIVDKYKLTHQEKERIVDIICSKYLKDILANYELQRIGDTRVDEFVHLQTIEENLPEAVERYVEKYPRS